ncbi:hypothetical protein IWQ57_001503 [Coemansia nantahalensis]|uniref:Uncharacterized protein n=1 Tax=Coemansia nantahalensis TaxID=2789366 RepID=A0ACC1K494_9FUNG|nr:hypothetical protein IWQ57_001503 [Coemansia nantahalensis]
MHEIQPADCAACGAFAYSGSTVGRRASRVAYTHSDCSSSLSSLSAGSIGSRGRARRRAWPAAWGGRWRPGVAFLAAATGTGVVGAHGVFQALYQNQFADGLQAAALVGALQLGSFIALRPLVAWTAVRCGRQAVLAAGALLASGGMLAAGFAAPLWQLCMAQGVLVGAGACACETAGFSTDPLARDLAQWAVAGGGIGGAALALTAAALAQWLGSAALALRWLALVVCIGQLAALVLLGRRPAGRVAAASGKPAGGVRPLITTSVIWARDGPRQWQAPGVLGAAGGVLHSLGAPLPLLYLPSYAALRLPSAARPLASAVPLVLLCLAAAAGAPLARALLVRHSLRPALLLGATRAALSLALWCLWLPADRSWAATCTFALFYGLMLGAAGYAQCQDADRPAPPAAVVLPVAGAVAMAGAAAAAWLVATPDRSPPFMPLIAFAAAVMLVAAAATTAGVAWQARSLSRRGTRATVKSVT